MCRLRCGQPCGSAAHRRTCSGTAAASCRRTCPAGRQSCRGAAGLCPCAGNGLVYLSVENLSASTLPVGASYLQSREVCTLGDLYSMGTGVTAVCDGKPVRCGSFAAPLYGENAADASVFTLNIASAMTEGVPERNKRPSEMQLKMPQMVFFCFVNSAHSARRNPIPSAPARSRWRPAQCSCVRCGWSAACRRHRKRQRWSLCPASM